MLLYFRVDMLACTGKVCRQFVTSLCSDRCPSPTIYTLLNILMLLPLYLIFKINFQKGENTGSWRQRYYSEIPDFACSSPSCLKEVFSLVLFLFQNKRSPMFVSICSHGSAQAISINSFRLVSLSCFLFLFCFFNVFFNPGSSVPGSIIPGS